MPPFSQTTLNYNGLVSPSKSIQVFGMFGDYPMSQVKNDIQSREGIEAARIKIYNTQGGTEYADNFDAASLSDGSSLYISYNLIDIEYAPVIRMHNGRPVSYNGSPGDVNTNYIYMVGSQQWMTEGAIGTGNMNMAGFISHDGTRWSLQVGGILFDIEHSDSCSSSTMPWQVAWSDNDNNGINTTVELTPLLLSEPQAGTKVKIEGSVKIVGSAKV